jgi:hypothetical protein
MIEPSSPASRLRRKIDFALPLLFSTGDAIYKNQNGRERYCEYLIVLHGMIRASVPLMEKAVEIAECKHRDDPVAAGVANYLRQHIPEEVGHDEWLLQDLEVIGINPSVALSRVPSCSVAALVGAQYYWILLFHPLALLGYIAVMEGYPPANERIDQLAERTGLPNGAFRTLRKHAILDPHHRDALDNILDALPLTSDQEALLGLSAFHTVSTVTDALGIAAGIDQLPRSYD